MPRMIEIYLGCECMFSVFLTLRAEQRFQEPGGTVRGLNLCELGNLRGIHKQGNYLYDLFPEMPYNLSLAVRRSYMRAIKRLCQGI